MSDTPSLLIGGNAAGHFLMDASMANRHGLIAGATGTGKTVTLQNLTESFSRLGVPVFIADVKGDLSGLAALGSHHPKIDARVKQLNIENYQFRSVPTVFWDVFGTNGHHIRATISAMGPLLLGSLLELNDTQSGVLYACFKVADDNGWLLLDLKDLRAMLTWLSDNANELKGEYGNISSSSIGAIQRKLLVLDEQGAEHFFNEPAIELDDLIKTDFSGNGVVNVLDATKLIHDSPKLYACFLIWLLAELFEKLPEVGDADRPKFVLFFDEAHLIFDGAANVLVNKIEQVVRLIRSKGVGVYFVSQSPADIPEDILGQLGMKIQHALRAFTPKDKKAVQAAAATFRQNPNINTEQLITELGVGEALVSVLDADGKPTPVELVYIKPPESRLGPLTEAERAEHIARSPYKGRYDKVIDRESAYELLKQKTEKLAESNAQAAAQKPAAKAQSTRQTPIEAMVKSAARSIGSQLGRQIMRGVLGSLFGKR
ncbi:helicase HerA-like domain-containing protein [Oceanisphaera sp. W20_SRM_FM3]|uniref:helicase HerA-like domain-containing protein n=1 Tax=Oceanisphaera sp. W20_SRM_FM3 TaxID=3240267 RepID=UPI003F965AB2